ncbi:MAG: DUF1800 family protein [Burkholderiales bacterium]|nr:DUF1800 family protein [Burkholderiales bacterium]
MHDTLTLTATLPAVADASTPVAPGAPAAPATVFTSMARTSALAAPALMLAGCGSGSDTASPPTPPPTPVGPSAAQASRFLAQASMGADRTRIERVQALGYAGWLDEQFAMAPSMSRCDWLVSKGYDQPGTNNAFKNGFAGFDSCAWKKLIASPDTLRQRVTLALSELLVSSLLGYAGGWRAFAGARYLDLLEANAFGNYRLVNGAPVETYGLADVTGLARIFTGWEWDLSVGSGNTPDFQRRPMVQNASRHETGASTFLGATVPAGSDGAAHLRSALDIVFAHPNVAPFVSRQLIQKLVTSNPSPAYVQRVASVFLDDGAGVRGNLKAVVRALLLDSEARSVPAPGALGQGKLREPMLRFLGWARAYGLQSPGDLWAVGDTSDAATRLGQSPLRSPSVFNFFRPGYVPPNSGIAAAALVAPEFQLTNESSVVGYLNFMQQVIGAGIGDMKPDYASLLPLADDANALLAEINLVMAADQVSAATLAPLAAAVASMPSGTATARNNRIGAALTLVMAAPEYQVLK